MYFQVPNILVESSMGSREYARNHYVMNSEVGRFLACLNSENQIAVLKEFDATSQLLRYWTVVGSLPVHAY